MGGLVIAFKKYNVRQGIWGSAWVGLDNFVKFFTSYKFPIIMKNTLMISLYSLAVSFPIPIIFALLLNAMLGKRYKKAIQTITYVPYFISTVVMVGLIFQVLNNRSGIYGSLYTMFTNRTAPNILADGKLFKHIYVWSGVFILLRWPVWTSPFMRRLRLTGQAGSSGCSTSTFQPYSQPPALC